MLGFDALAKLPLAALPDDLAQTLRPDLFLDADQFFQATVSPGTATISPDLYLDPEQFFQASIGRSIHPALFHDADQFFSVSVTYGLRPALFEDPDQFFEATIGTGGTVLAPAFYLDPDQFFEAQINLRLHADLFLDQDRFFGQVVGLGTPPEPFPANICMRTGFKTTPDRLVREWNGTIVRFEDFERRQPQDFVRGVTDNQRVPVPKPEPPDHFLDPNDVTADSL